MKNKVLTSIIQMLCWLNIFLWFVLSTVNVYLPEQSKASVDTLLTFGIDTILAMIVLCTIAIKDKDK